VEGKFDALKDPAERTYLKRLRTSFHLPLEILIQKEEISHGGRL
jgi:hypothetical protein